MLVRGTVSGREDLAVPDESGFGAYPVKGDELRMDSGLGGNPSVGSCKLQYRQKM